MKISISSTGMKKGDRVIVKVEKDEWYLGLISRGGKKLHVDFDDGHEAVIEGADLKHVKAVVSKIKKTKIALNDKAAELLYTVQVEKKQVGKNKSALVPVRAKPAVKPAVADTETDAIKLDRKLGLLLEQQNGGSWRDRSQLQAYLEGDVVKPSWIEQMSVRRSKTQPTKLYRTVVVSDGAHIGTNVNTDKKLSSASDSIASCIYAACSYHNDTGTSLKGKQLAVIEIHNPVCVMSLHELMESQKNVHAHIRQRVQNEREFLITGAYKSTIIHLVKPDAVAGGYRHFHKMTPKQFLEYAVAPVVKSSLKPNFPMTPAMLDMKLGVTETQQKNLPSAVNHMYQYLIGEKVPDDWIELAATRKSNGVVPFVLYRLCVVSKESGIVGKRISMSKPLISASDRETNAIYAGCSYHNNHSTNIAGKQLVIVAIKNPVCAFTLDELLEIMKGDGGTRFILKQEREYLLTGPIKALVVSVVPNTMLTKGGYLKLENKL